MTINPAPGGAQTATTVHLDDVLHLMRAKVPLAEVAERLSVTVADITSTLAHARSGATWGLATSDIEALRRLITAERTAEQDYARTVREQSMRASSWRYGGM